MKIVIEGYSEDNFEVRAKTSGGYSYFRQLRL